MVLQVVVNEQEADTIREQAKRLGVSHSLLVMAALFKATDNLTSFDDLPLEDLLGPFAGRTKGQKRRAIKVPLDTKG